MEEMYSARYGASDLTFLDFKPPIVYSEKEDVGWKEKNKTKQALLFVASAQINSLSGITTQYLYLHII